MIAYTEYAGCALTAHIPVKFGTAHGRSRPDVGSAKRIDAYGRKGVTPAPRVFGTSDKKMMTPTLLLGPKHNFHSLTICKLHQYLPNGSENKVLLSIDSSDVAYYQYPFAVTAARSKYGKPVCAVYTRPPTSSATALCTPLKSSMKTTFCCYPCKQLQPCKGNIRDLIS